MRYFLVLSAFLLIALSSCNLAESAPEHPNIVLIMPDDLNDWQGFMHRHPNVKTPNLDRLAEKSIVFDNAHAPATLCNPSRTALLTSKYPHNTGIYTNHKYDKSEEMIVEQKLPTLMKSFKDNGYKVFGTGKILHFTNQYQKRYYHDFFASRAGKDHNISRTKLDWAIWEKPEADLSDSKKTQWAIEKITAKHKKPFFMILGYDTPHTPWVVPKKYFDLYDMKELKLPPVLDDDLADLPGYPIEELGSFHRKMFAKFKKQGKWKELVRAYLASTSYLDAQIGQLLDALAASENAKNTVVIFTSDHGYHMGEKDTIKKNTLWERSTHVPMTFYLPWQDNLNQRSNKAVNLVDLFPTLIELCNLPEEKNLDGHSMLSLLKSPDAKWDYKSFTTQGEGNHSIQDEQWHYIRYSNGEEELYDKQKDLYEFNNLAKDKQYKALIKQYRALLPDSKDS